MDNRQRSLTMLSSCIEKLHNMTKDEIKEKLVEIECMVSEEFYPKCTCSKCTGLPDVEFYYCDEECPECGSILLVQPSGGVKCSNCSYWFCY